MFPLIMSCHEYTMFSHRSIIAARPAIAKAIAAAPCDLEATEAEESLPSPVLLALAHVSWTVGFVSSDTLARVFQPQTTKTGQTVFTALS